MPEEVVEEQNEKEFLKGLKKKSNTRLIDLSIVERERIAQYICNLYTENIDKHKELCDKIDDWDNTYRMVWKAAPGSDGQTPNYVTPLSTVTLETLHANILNVFFTPKDVMRVLPTESGDIPKVNKLDLFGNWSMKNELHLFENIDRLFHSSGKNGECPYMVHWCKKYGTAIERNTIPDPNNPDMPLMDEETQKPIIKETKKTKLLYDAPILEVFSRKDYMCAPNALMDDIPSWEMRITRINRDDYLRDQLKGDMYEDSISEILGWGGLSSMLETSNDAAQEPVPIGKNEQKFIEFYGRLKINAVKSRNAENDIEEEDELEDEFIAIVHPDSMTLCSLRENKFPLRIRPIGLDVFIPDDEGRRKGIGIFEFMDSIQKAYDTLHNQFVFGVIQSNNPFGFFSPIGNKSDEPIKIRNGYLFPTSDPNSVNIVQLPPPNRAIQDLMELVRFWAQMLFGVSDYTSGMESQIDPSAPVKKAEIVVGQGNVRMNAIIKRKNKTLEDIFKRWYLLYNENLPPNKFIRITGEDADTGWEFEKIDIADFSLNSIPDFELTGNILNSNKTLDANKKLAIYNLLVQNPFFNPSSVQGIQALHSLTKWLINGMEETGLSSFLPKLPTEQSLTPEEENARFLQGDKIKPKMGEQHIEHIRTHQKMLLSPYVPDEIKQRVVEHIKETVMTMKQEVTQAYVLSQSGVDINAFNQSQMNQGGGSAVGTGTQVSERAAPSGQLSVSRVG